MKKINYDHQPFIDIIQKHLKGKVDNLEITVSIRGSMTCTFMWEGKLAGFVVPFDFPKEPIDLEVGGSQLTDEELERLRKVIEPMELELNNEWL